MNLIELVGASPAVVLNPQDIVVVTVDRYLTGQQLDVINKHFQRKLPKNQVLVMMKGMSLHAAPPRTDTDIPQPMHHPV